MADGVANRRKLRGSGFDNQKKLLTRFNFSLPAINRLNSGNKIDAGCKPAFDQVARDLTGLIFGSGRGENDSLIGHGSTIAHRPQAVASNVAPSTLFGRVEKEISVG